MNWYWKQYTEDRPYESGWMRPYTGDPMGFCEKRGMTAWGHYIPTGDTSEPDASKQAWFDKLKYTFKWDRRPHLLSFKGLMDGNEHAMWVDGRRNFIPGYWYHYSVPQQNWRSTWKMQTPPWLLQDNWKPITLSEEIAHKERNEIAGRNRRYFYKLKYHPINGKFFHRHTSDAQWVKYARVRHELTSVWGEDQHQRAGFNWYVKWYLLPALFMLYTGFLSENHPENSKYRSVVGNYPKIYQEYALTRPTNFIQHYTRQHADTDPVHSGDDWLFGNGFSGLFWIFTQYFDDQGICNKEQWNQYKRVTESVVNSPQPINKSIYADEYRTDPMGWAERKSFGRDPVHDETNGIDRYNT